MTIHSFDEIVILAGLFVEVSHVLDAQDSLDQMVEEKLAAEAKLALVHLPTYYLPCMLCIVCCALYADKP